MATTCVYDCLREAHLEQYHPYFVKKELLQCDHLASIQMHDYASLGVVSMADRVRLFKLVNHIKSLHSSGRLCPHSASQESEANYRITEQALPDFNTRNVPQIQHKPPQHDHERKIAGAPVKQPKRETRYLAKCNESVEFRPGTPMFKCRRVLTFSDSDLEDNGDDEVLPPAKSSNTELCDCEKEEVFTEPNLESREDAASTSPNVSPTKLETGNKESPRNQEQTDSASALYSEHLQAANCPGGDFESLKEERIRNRWDHIIFGERADSNKDKLTSGAHSYSPKATSGVQCEILGNTNPEARNTLYASSNFASRAASSVPTQGIFTSQVNSSLSKDSYTQRRTKIISKHTAGAGASLINSQGPAYGSSHVGSKMVKRSKNGVAMDIVEKGAMRLKKGAFATPSKPSADAHAYFPKNLNKSINSKATKVKTLVHTAGYDYGVPNSPSLHKSRQGVQENERIKVCIRKRPVNRKETLRHELDVIRIDGDTSVIVEENKVAIDLSNFIQEHVFKFDEVFHSECNNEDVYENTAKPLVSHLLKGGRSTCFAFGQTGSGKTYTLLGNSKVAGLYEHAGRDIFEQLVAQGTKTPYSLHISYFEIYCGHLHDLLNKRHRVQVRENAKKQVCIAGLMETKVTSPAHLKKIVEYGNHFRKTGTTGVNNSSSRSHAILQMELQSFSGRRYGRLSFIDLAGSERAADSVNSNRRTQIEGAGINQSLLALKECIRSIDQENGHTPYRQSKLTHILRDSFIGDSRTCMIANISPTQTACENTLNTLRYAHRVKDIYGTSRASNSSRAPKSPKANTSKSPQVTKSKNTQVKATSSQVLSAKPIFFHPSNIQLASTPKKTEGEHCDVASQNLPSRRIIQDTNESPIRGHHVKRNQENGDSSLTSAYFSDIDKSNPSMGDQVNSRQSKYSPLRYTSQSRIALNNDPKSTAEYLSNNEPSGQMLRHLSEEDRNNLRLDCGVQTRERPIEMPSTASEADVINHHGVGMKSLDRAAEYLMEVSHKIKYNYETVVASSQSAEYPQQGTGKSPQDHAEDFSASITADDVTKADLLQRHNQVLSDFDRIVDMASIAVGGTKAFNEHPIITRTNSENLDTVSTIQSSERGEIGTHVSTENIGTSLKSRSEPSLYNLKSEVQKQLPKSSFSTGIGERNRQGVYCDKEPPIARPNSWLQQSKSEVRDSQVHQANLASQNVPRLSKGLGDYSEKPSVGSYPELKTALGTTQNYDITNTSQYHITKTALPSPADFLQSLAHMKQLPKQTGERPMSALNDYNRETLSRLGQSFLTADSTGRQFQEMLGSPSNTRASSSNSIRHGLSGDTAVSNDLQENSSHHLEGNVNCAEASSTTEQEGDSGLGASAGFKQISCDGETSETDTMADVPSIAETRYNRSGHVDYSTKGARPKIVEQQRPVSADSLSKMTKEDMSGKDSKDQPFHGTQNHLLTAHEDQLSHITDLCKQEMNLLVQVRSGHLSFPTYVKCLQELLSSKADVLASLNSQLEIHTQ